MKKMLILGLLTLSSPLSVWAASSSGGEAPKVHSCQTLTQVKNTQTPVALTVSMVQCIRDQRYDDAVDLFNITGVFAKFDTLRVPDKTAHQAYSVLKMQAAQALTEQQTEEFDARLKSKLGEDSYHPQLCKAVKKIGAPTYQPTYMRNHGMAAFIGPTNQQENPPKLGVETGFDEGHAWDYVVESYLKCSQ